jgi:hypothetical protein
MNVELDGEALSIKPSDYPDTIGSDGFVAKRAQMR